MANVLSATNATFTLKDENDFEEMNENNKNVDGKEIELGRIGTTAIYKDDGSIGKNKTKVARTVGLVGGCSMLIGSMIGSGIFASTAPVFNHAGSIGLSLIVWVVSGLLAVGASLCYAELGTMIPKSGGEFPYLQEIYGNCPAFLMTFCNVLVLKPAQMAAISITTADYIVEPFVIFHHNPEYRLIATKWIAAFSLGI